MLLETTIPKSATDFYIEIDYKKGSGSPSRVFRAMSDLIDALQDTDRSLIRTLDSKLNPVLLLEDVETGSIRSWLRQEIERVDDDAIKSGDYKKVIALYLVRCKYAIIRFLDKKTDLSDTGELEELENHLLKVAEDTDIKMLPAYEPVPREKLVRNIEKINNALAPLNDDDSATFVSQEGETEFNLTLYISPETIEDLITAETIESEMQMIIKVKKPDFLGVSQWDFRYDNRTISATIIDSNWLEKFQSGQIPIVPGDAIRAKVLTQVRYGFDREVVATHYTIVEVLEVIHRDDTFQPPLLG